MQTIIEWKARRAGGRITINGADHATGEPIKIVGVDEIESGRSGGRPIATDKDGNRYELA